MPLSFNLIQKNVTVFPQQFKGDFSDIFSRLVETGHFSDEISIKLPVFQQSPLDTPVIIMKSDDGKTSCLITREKLQLSWDDDAFGGRSDDQKRFVSEIVESSVLDNSIVRVGNIAEYAFEIDEVRGYPSYFKSGFLDRKRSLLDSFNFEFSLNDSYQIGEKSIPCNKSIKILSANRNTDQKKIIVLIVDFNTKADEMISWSVSDLSNFLDRTNDKLDYADISQEFFSE